MLYRNINSQISQINLSIVALVPCFSDHSLKVSEDRFVLDRNRLVFSPSPMKFTCKCKLRMQKAMPAGQHGHNLCK